MEFVLQYQFDNGLRPSISYVQSKVKDKTAGNFDMAEYIQAGVLYKLTANVQLWFDHRFNWLTKIQNL